jgi:hypothetical protein
MFFCGYWWISTNIFKVMARCMKETVQIVILSRDRPKYRKESLDSVLNQNLSKDYRTKKTTNFANIQLDLPKTLHNLPKDYRIYQKKTTESIPKRLSDQVFCYAQRSFARFYSLFGRPYSLFGRPYSLLGRPYSLFM